MYENIAVYLHFPFLENLTLLADSRVRKLLAVCPCPITRPIPDFFNIVDG